MTVRLVIFKEKVFFFLVFHLTLQNRIWELTAGHVTENSLDMTKNRLEKKVLPLTTKGCFLSSGIVLNTYVANKLAHLYIIVHTL